MGNLSAKQFVEMAIKRGGQTVTSIMHDLRVEGYNLYHAAQALQLRGFNVVVREGLRFPEHKQLVWINSDGSEWIEPWIQNAEDRRSGKYPKTLPFWVHAKEATKLASGKFQFVWHKQGFVASTTQWCTDDTTAILARDPVIGWCLLEIETNKVALAKGASPLEHHS